MYRAEIEIMDEQGTTTTLAHAFIRETRDEAEDAACMFMNDSGIEDQYGEECTFSVHVVPHTYH
jgi:hypothetical protein